MGPPHRAPSWSVANEPRCAGERKQRLASRRARLGAPLAWLLSGWLGPGLGFGFGFQLDLDWIWIDSDFDFDFYLG